MPNTSVNLSMAALAALFAISGEASAQDKAAPSCNPSAGRASARIECLTKTTRALTEKLDSMQAELAQQTSAFNSADYVRRSDLDSYLGGYVKYNAPLAIGMAAEPDAGQSNGRCLVADMAMEAVAIDDACNVNAKSELKWKLVPIGQSSAENR